MRAEGPLLDSGARDFYKIAPFSRQKWPWAALGEAERVPSAIAHEGRDAGPVLEAAHIKTGEWQGALLQQ
ncbi:MAG: hypothetical protein ACI8TQ_001976 [Planctomycetota bacterium]